MRRLAIAALFGGANVAAFADAQLAPGSIAVPICNAFDTEQHPLPAFELPVSSKGREQP